MKNQAGMNPITEDDTANYLGNNPDFFERHAQPLATGRIQIAPQCDQAAKGTQAGLGRRRQRQFVQPVAEKNPENIDATQQLHAGLTPDVARQPVHRSSHRWAYP